MTAGIPSTFPFNDGGHHRMAVKLPSDWGGFAIDGLRVRFDASFGSLSPATARIISLKVLQVTSAWQVIRRSLPPVITVSSAPSLVPTGIPG